MIKNVFIEISYDGSEFNGWQRLPNDLSVQGYLEKTFSRLLKQEILIDGSGRTDKGVHAINQSFTFKYEDNVPVKNLKYFLGNKLVKSVKIQTVKEVSSDFHARYSAVKKSYIYKINFNKDDQLFYRNYFWFTEELNIEMMKKASEYLTGEHDFVSFSSIRNKEKLVNTIRNIDSIDFELENGIFIIRFIGNGFLYHMIRLIVHHLVQVGLEKRHPDSTDEILKSCSRKVTTRLAPPSGLYLEKVYY
jgi:tRNA pseudouridine38-40 synthase